MENNLFSGNKDINYHPVNENTVYHNAHNYELFNETYSQSLETEYCGVMYFHLKGLKNDRPYGDHEQNKIISFDELCSPACQKRLRRRLNFYERSLTALYDFDVMRELALRLTGKPPTLRQVRLARLAGDLDGIDFERDAVNHLPD